MGRRLVQDLDSTSRLFRDFYAIESDPLFLAARTDRPDLARMDNAPAERLDPLQRLGDIAHREVGQGVGIAGAASAGVDANRGGFRVRLPAFSLSGVASLQGNVKEPRPEASCASGIISGKLDE